jgi:hypothetical protein
MRILLPIVLLIGGLLISSGICQGNYLVKNCDFRSGPKFGGRLKIEIPDGAIYKRANDVDYDGFFVGFGPKKNRFWLHTIWGPYGSSGQPPKEWISASVSVLTTTILFDGGEGVDARGVYADGNRWRFIGKVGEEFSYNKASENSAAYFDRMLNTLCFDKKVKL